MEVFEVVVALLLGGQDGGTSENEWKDGDEPHLLHSSGRDRR